MCTNAAARLPANAPASAACMPRAHTHTHTTYMGCWASELPGICPALIPALIPESRGAQAKGAAGQPASLEVIKAWASRCRGRRAVSSSSDLQGCHRAQLGFHLETWLHGIYQPWGADLLGRPARGVAGVSRESDSCIRPGRQSLYLTTHAQGASVGCLSGHSDLWEPCFLAEVLLDQAEK